MICFLFVVQDSCKRIWTNAHYIFIWNQQKILTICWQTHCTQNNKWFFFFIYSTFVHRFRCIKESMSIVWHKFYSRFSEQHHIRQAVHSVSDSIVQAWLFGIYTIYIFDTVFGHYFDGMALNWNWILNVCQSSWTHFKWFSIDARCHRIHQNWFVHVAKRRFRILTGSLPLLHDAAVAVAAKMLTQCTVCYWFY